MDDPSRHSVLLLDALAYSVDQIRSFGYGLFLERKAPHWMCTNNLYVSGEGFHITQGDQTRCYRRSLSFGCSIYIDNTNNHYVVFGILFAWDDAHWLIQSSVEEEDLVAPATITLWESPESHATTVGDAIQGLQRAFAALVESVNYENVAACLNRIVQRK